MPKISRRLIILLIVLAVVIAAYFAVISPGTKTITLTSSQLITDLQQGIDPAGGSFTALAVLTIKDTSLTVVIDGKTYAAIIPSNFDAFQVFAPQIGNGTVTVNYQGTTWWKNWGIIVVTGVASFLIGFLGGYLWRRQRQA
jgi:hypothetical protein